MQCSLICISLILFLSCQVTADSFPQSSVIGCYSLDKNHTKLSFYCSNAEKLFNEICATTTLSEAMQKLNASAVIEMKMCGCAIDTLVEVKKQLGNVRVLDISHSHYGSDRLFGESIVDVLFNRKLVKLNAAHNSLTRIPDELFFKMPNLTVIDLSYNQLGQRNGTTFKGASELVEIHLQENGLWFLKEGAFSDLNKLKYLDLRDNYLRGILSCDILSLLNNNHSIKIFISWQFFDSLDIRCIKTELKVHFDDHESIALRNGIVELHCNQNSFRNFRLIVANINQKKNLYEIVSTLRQTLKLLRYLDVSGADLVEFDFSILRSMKQLFKLDISNCNLKKTINSSALQFIGIEYFHANGNQIQNAYEIIEYSNPSMKELFLAGNFIGKLNSTAIIKMQNLIKLDLSNTNLQLVGSYPFDQLESMTDLDISANNLNNMNFTISFSSELKYFNLSGCQVENASDVIKLLGSEIEILDLSGNVVGKLDESKFDGMTELIELYLENTSLSINDGSNPFERLTLLQNLDISQNNLINVNWTLLSSTLAQLRHLNAAGCQSANALDLIKLLGSHIRRLDLSGNIVGKVNGSTFERFERLNVLNLSNTSLLNFDFNILEHAKELNELDISHNRFEKLNVSLQMDELYKLNLHGCELTEIFNFDKFHLPNLKWLGISKNRLSCETLEQIKNVWPKLEFIDNDQSQNDQPNCRQFETTTDLSTEAPETHD